MNIGLDFDDTLVESFDALSTTIIQLGKTMGIEIPLDKIDNSKGLDQILGIFFPSELIDTAKKNFMNLYPILGIPLIQWKNQALELLENLNNENNRLFLISAKQQINLELALKKLKGLHYFHKVIGNSHGEQKAHLIQKLRIEIYLGDSFLDMRAAEIAGIRGVQLTDRKTRENQITNLLEFLYYVK